MRRTRDVEYGTMDMYVCIFDTHVCRLSFWLDVTLIWDFLQPYTRSMIMEAVKVPREVARDATTIREYVDNRRSEADQCVIVEARASINVNVPVKIRSISQPRQRRA